MTNKQTNLLHGLFCGFNCSNLNFEIKKRYCDCFAKLQSASFDCNHNWLHHSWELSPHRPDCCDSMLYIAYPPTGLSVITRGSSRCFRAFIVFLLAAVYNQSRSHCFVTDSFGQVDGVCRFDVIRAWPAQHTAEDTSRAPPQLPRAAGKQLSLQVRSAELWLVWNEHLNVNFLERLMTDSAVNKAPCPESPRKNG